MPDTIVHFLSDILLLIQKVEEISSRRSTSEEHPKAALFCDGIVKKVDIDCHVAPLWIAFVRSRFPSPEFLEVLLALLATFMATVAIAPQSLLIPTATNIFELRCFKCKGS